MQDKAPWPRRRALKWVLSLAAMSLICGIILSILLPVFASARVAGQMATGLSRMKNLTQAALIYTDKYDDRFPPRMESALAAKAYLMPYALEPSDFESVGSQDVMILGDPRFDGLRLERVYDPEHAVMFYESRSWLTDRIVMGCANGRTKQGHLSEVQKSLSEPLFEGDPQATGPAKSSGN